jgi:hypothetical protein
MLYDQVATETLAWALSPPFLLRLSGAMVLFIAAFAEFSHDFSYPSQTGPTAAATARLPLSVSHYPQETWAPSPCADALPPPSSLMTRTVGCDVSTETQALSTEAVDATEALHSLMALLLRTPSPRLQTRGREDRGYAPRASS